MVSERIMETTWKEVDGSVSRECASNTLEIRIKREEKQILRYEEGGELVKVESRKAPPYPIPHLVLENIISFEHIDIDFLYPTFQDLLLCLSITREIVYQAKQGGQGPLYISVDITLTPQTILGESTRVETCAICLEDSRDLCQLQNCPHSFHDDCINEWLCKSNTCPLCRTLLMD